MNSEKHMEDKILYLDRDLLVLNKEAGWLSQKDKSRDHDCADLLKSFFAKQQNIATTLNHFKRNKVHKQLLQSLGTTIEEELNQIDFSFIAPIHRLDRNTSGLLIFALSSNAASTLSKLIKKNEIKRSYLALIKGKIEKSGKIDLPISKDTNKNISYVDEQNGKAATTLFKKVEDLPNCSLVEVNLLTGRSHQIRVHFSHLGKPLIGDKKYGKKPWSEIFPRPALHATKLQFPHPTHKIQLELFAQIPEDIHNFINKLKN